MIIAESRDKIKISGQVDAVLEELTMIISNIYQHMMEVMDPGIANKMMTDVITLAMLPDDEADAYLAKRREEEAAAAAAVAEAQAQQE